MHQPLSTRTTALLRHLEREELLLRESLAKSNELFAALRRGDLPAPQQLSSQQEPLAAALRDAADARSTSAADLAREVGLSGEGVTLANLAAKLPESLAADVAAVRTRLAQVAAELADVQARNANLVGHLRSYLRGVLSGPSGTESPSRYGPSGARLDTATPARDPRERATA